MLQIIRFSACLTAAFVLFLRAATRRKIVPALLALMLVAVAMLCS